MKSIGVVVDDAGAAIVSVERKDDDLLATGIERLPFDLAVVARRVRELDEPDVRFVVDSEGIGNALWMALGGPTDPRHWQLYSGRGMERQALVDPLLVAIQEGRFHFAPNLSEQPSMSKAMVGFRRSVKDDGLIGSELVVALLLAIHNPVTVAEGWFAYA